MSESARQGGQTAEAAHKSLSIFQSRTSGLPKTLEDAVPDVQVEDPLLELKVELFNRRKHNDQIRNLQERHNRST